jgi:hypothetical protein
VKNIEAATTDELVARYAEAARRHGEATDEAGPPANPEADEISSIYRELRRRHKEPVLLALLDSEDAGVRAWAGAHALEFAPDQAEPVLSQLAEEDGLVAFGAKITLLEWRAGRLQFS